MPRIEIKELLDAGVHFGHLKRKWNPNMAPYIFMERNGIHIIDLQKTQAKIDEACDALRQIARSGRKILFVATKKQAKDIVAEKVKEVNMPYVTERWPGGMLTNFPTIRKTIKKMTTIDKMMNDGSFDNLSKRERLQIERQRAKLEKNFGSIADMNRTPSAMFIVDVGNEHIALREAQILNIPVIGMVDTNSNPSDLAFPIPANDDASKSIALIIEHVCKAIEEGLNERKTDKEKEKAEGGGEESKPKEKKTRRKTTKVETSEGQSKEEEPAKQEEKEKTSPAKNTKQENADADQQTKEADNSQEVNADEEKSSDQ